MIIIKKQKKKYVTVFFVPSRPYLVNLILIGGRVKLFGNHEGCMIGFQEALLIRPRVQVA